MKPIVKWAGGKGQLLSRLNKKLPKEYNRYYEPFVGGGAFLFELAPSNAQINDINKELINMYKRVRDNVEELIESLSGIDKHHAENPKEFYYSKRDRYNQKIANQEYDVEMASLFIYLNKHCFNGLYRVNSKGLFNVPFNNRKSGQSFDEINLRRISKYLKKITIYCGDFAESLTHAQAGDFVFFDSPYAPLNDTSFESYTKMGFSEGDHIRLSNLFKELTNRGVYCMLTNHNTSLIRNLYKDFHCEVVSVKRMINSDASNREGEEVIITNFSGNADD